MTNSLLCIFIASLSFATFEPVSKLITGDISPIGITCIRFLIGALILLPFALSSQKKNNIKLTGKDFLMLSFLGVLCICVSMLILQFAVKEASSPAIIAIIFSSNSVFTIILSIFVLKTKLTVRKSAALVLCLIGILICADLSVTTPLSVILAVASALTFSLYTVYSKKYSAKISGIIQTSYSFLIGSIVLLVYLLLSSAFQNVQIIYSITMKTVLVMAYLSIIVTGVGYWAFFRVMEKTSALAASFVFFIKPILTPFVVYLVSVIFAGGAGANPFTLRNFLAIIFVLAGSYLVIDRKVS